MSHPRNIFAWTAPGGHYPEFVSFNERDGKITLDARGSVDAEGRCGTTIQIELPPLALAELGKAAICEVIPADLGAGTSRRSQDPL